MKPAHFAFLAIFIAQLAACTHTPSTQTGNIAASSGSELVGCWHGEDYQPAMRQSAAWLMNRKQDGTFNVDFWSWSSSGRLNKQAEAGRWISSREIYTTITTEIDGQVLQESYVDDYEIRSFDGTDMAYFHVKAGLTFKSKKVSCDFVPPSPRKLESPA